MAQPDKVVELLGLCDLACSSGNELQAIALALQALVIVLARIAGEAVVNNELLSAQGGGIMS